MKLTGKLKKQVENTHNKEEAKDLIEQAGMLLSDDELNLVCGGGNERIVYPIFGEVDFCCLCGNDEPGTVTFQYTDESGRMTTYYCSACQKTFTVYG